MISVSRSRYTTCFSSLKRLRLENIWMKEKQMSSMVLFLFDKMRKLSLRSGSRELLNIATIFLAAPAPCRHTPLQIYDTRSAQAHLQWDASRRLSWRCGSCGFWETREQGSWSSDNFLRWIFVKISSSGCPRWRYLWPRSGECSVSKDHTSLWRNCTICGIMSHIVIARIAVYLVSRRHWSELMTSPPSPKLNSDYSLQSSLHTFHSRH